MIKLTNPIKVPNSIGGTGTINYDTLDISNITADPVGQTINANVRIYASSSQTQPVITGTLSIVAGGNSPLAVITVPDLNFYWNLVLSGATLTAVQGWTTTLQNSIEAGLVGAGAITGVQSAGV